jgi:hypothetical protein
MIRPTFVTRGNDLANLWGDFPRVKLDYLLDEEFLWKVRGKESNRERRGREERERGRGKGETRGRKSKERRRETLIT